MYVHVHVMGLWSLCTCVSCVFVLIKSSVADWENAIRFYLSRFNSKIQDFRKFCDFVGNTVHACTCVYVYRVHVYVN